MVWVRACLQAFGRHELRDAGTATDRNLMAVQVSRRLSPRVRRNVLAPALAQCPTVIAPYSAEVFGFRMGAVIAKIDFLGPTSDSVYRISEARVGADDCFAAGARPCGIVLPGRGIRGSKLATSHFADVHVHPSRLGDLFGLATGFLRNDIPLNTDRGRIGFVWEAASLRMHRFNPAELRSTRIC